MAAGRRALASAALFCVLTYIAPLLRDVTGVSERGVTGVLFGVALTVGSTLGGRLGDRNLEFWLTRMFAGLVLVFLALSQAVHALAPCWRWCSSGARWASRWCRCCRR